MRAAVAGGPGGLGLLDVMVQPEDEAVEEVVLRRDLRLEITLWPQRCEEACSQIWPGGLVLSHYLVEGRGGKWASKLATSPQQRIIELGSGTGICGMTAAALGGRVIATDLAECLPILSKNLAHNTVTITQHGGSIEAAPLHCVLPHSSAISIRLKLVLLPFSTVASPSFKPDATSMSPLRTGPMVRIGSRPQYATAAPCCPEFRTLPMTTGREDTIPIRCDLVVLRLIFPS